MYIIYLSNWLMHLFYISWADSQLTSYIYSNDDAFPIFARYGDYFGDQNIPPRKIPPGRFHPGCFHPMKSMHGNNVVWLCAKYAVAANLFRLESSIITRVKRATNRNNLGGEHIPGWNVPGRFFRVGDEGYTLNRLLDTKPLWSYTRYLQTFFSGFG